MATVMIVEDEEDIRKILVQFLGFQNFNVVEAKNGKEALERLEEMKDKVDIILMDYNMPEIDGISATKTIREKKYPVVIIMITAFGDERTMLEAAKVGIDDFITKPVDLQQLASKLSLISENLSFYRIKQNFRYQISSSMLSLSEQIKSLKEEVELLLLETVETLYKVSEFRDDETHEHTLRVGWLSGRIAEVIGLDPEHVSKIQFASPLHDVGKIGIPDKILLKNAKLTDEEYKIMKTHVLIGYEILSGAASSILQCASKIALSHHERWNGSGYPYGLSGSEIPIEAQITAVTDSFDAIVSKRPYKPPRSLEDAFTEIKNLKGILYSPIVVDALFELSREVYDFYRGHES